MKKEFDLKRQIMDDITEGSMFIVKKIKGDDIRIAKFDPTVKIKYGPKWEENPKKPKKDGPKKEPKGK